MSRRRKRLGRKGKVWLSVGATLGGLGLVTAAAMWIDRSRETDLADATAGISQKFQHEIPDGAPPLRFAEVAAEVGIVMRHGPGERARRLPEDTGSGLAWGDVDGDGDPDLYAANFGAPNRLFRNDGGRFTDVTDAAGVGDSGGFGMGAFCADFDADGDLDLYVTNDGPNRLFRNRGDGTFEDVADAAGVLAPEWSVGAAWGDCDRDGDLDLYVCNYLQYEPAQVGDGGEDPNWSGVPLALNPNAFDPVANHLYLNRGDGTFEDAAERLGVHDPRGKSLSAVFCDLDGDGGPDLYINNDVSPNALFRNLGIDPGRPGWLGFEDISTQTGTADPRGSMGLSIADVVCGPCKEDGLPDLFITHWLAQENALYAGKISPTGKLLFLDRVRQLRLGEVSTGSVGWGSACADFDLDGRVDLVVINGNTLETKEAPRRLRPQAPFLFWNDGKRFHDLAPAAGEAFAAKRSARGLACADYDGDGDVDLAVLENRGALLLFRNDSDVPGTSLTVRLDGPPAARHGARVEVVTGAGRQTRWWGADASYASTHYTDIVFGLGAATQAAEVRVLWTDGTETKREGVPAGRITVTR